ncbi:MAG: hypothetical protein GX605_01955 [Chloroflexi bacterium]|nr:hypothetical protein [Chloroflexota bacterium]
MEEAMQLVARLEKTITEGLHIPFTSSVIVGEAECADIIDRLRTVLQQEERRMSSARSAKAGEDDSVVVGPVRPYIPPELADHELLQAAQAHAEQIITEARNQAEGIKADADGYILDELQQLQAQLEVVLRRIKNGIRTIQKEGGLSTRRPQDPPETP